MIHICIIRDVFVVAFLIIQIINASPLRLCPCSVCNCPKEIVCNNFSPPPCSCINYQNYQNSLCPINNPSSCCNEQNTGTNYQCCNIGSTCGCGEFSFNTQIPQSSQPLPKCPDYYTDITPSIPCPPQTYKNYCYQLQMPAASQCEPNYGFLNGINDKTHKKCSICPSKPLY